MRVITTEDPSIQAVLDAVLGQRPPPRNQHDFLNRVLSSCHSASIPADVEVTAEFLVLKKATIH